MRARNVKPGFFNNEQLAALPIAARLLFVGLWCMADREGRLEDRPVRIKMQIFPADMIDVEPLLQGLVEQSLIVRYAVDGKRCIWIPEFLKHQRPHHNEAKSFLPEFHGEPKLSTKVASPFDQGEQDFALNPDSLNPDSPLPPKGGESGFADFWQAYPRKIRKAAAMRAWLRKGLSAKSDEILAHLTERVRSDAQWLKDGGEYIPYPSTWLNGDGWLDEYQVQKTPRIAGI